MPRMARAHAAQSGFELAFRINQEVARNDHLLACYQSAQHDETVIHLGPQLHLTRFEVPGITSHEHDLLGPRIEHRAVRHRQLLAIIDGERRIGVHVGFQLEVGIGEFQWQL